MKQIKITKKCEFYPLGTDEKNPANRIPARPGQEVIVSAKEADKMIAGRVAVLVFEEKPGPKTAPTTRSKKVDATK